MTQLYPAQPNLLLTNDNLLQSPTEGQTWYNKTNGHLYVYDGTEWIPLSNTSDYAANCGQIGDGEYLPQPINSEGYVFRYDECIWNTSPEITDKLNYFICYADENGRVTMKYRKEGETTLTSGQANYLIVGIKQNRNRGLVSPPQFPPPYNPPTPTPTVSGPIPTPTPTPTVSGAVAAPFQFRVVHDGSSPANIDTDTVYVKNLLAGTIIDWGDGTQTTSLGIQFTYSKFYNSPPYNYIGKIYYPNTTSLVAVNIGGFQNNLSRNRNIVEIISFGNANIYSIGFEQCASLIKVPTSLPNSVTRLQNAFRHCESFNQNIDTWNVSNITNMSGMFYGCTNFNQNINNWNVSNVTNMYGMFFGCTNFNQPLNTWNVSNVTNMATMFNGCTNFNQPLNTWNVSNVTNMYAMFSGCTNFNQPLNTWDVSYVIDMSYMFNGCTNFNQNINNWNVSNVTNMCTMFAGCRNFNQPLNAWNVNNVIDMSRMFYVSKDFNQNINNWNVSNVTNMASMFGGNIQYNIPSYYNQPLNNWDVSNVINMDGMFENNKTFNQDLSDWCVSKIPTKPLNFDLGASVWNRARPIWGYCP